MASEKSLLTFYYFALRCSEVTSAMASNVDDTAVPGSLLERAAMAKVFHAQQYTGEEETEEMDSGQMRLEAMGYKQVGILILILSRIVTSFEGTWQGSNVGRKNRKRLTAVAVAVVWHIGVTSSVHNPLCRAGTSPQVRILGSLQPRLQHSVGAVGSQHAVHHRAGEWGPCCNHLGMDPRICHDLHGGGIHG